ncbi:MAG: PAS domain S-box protein [Desulfobacteraceae bacterium]|jgi:PAS domain S-box-containing protein
MTRKPTYKELVNKVQTLEHLLSQQNRIPCGAFDQPVFNVSNESMDGLSCDQTPKKNKVFFSNETISKRTLDNLKEGYYEIDLNGNYTYISQAICNFHKRSRNELIGTNALDFNPSCEHQNITAHFKRVFYKQISLGDIPFKIIDKAGNRILLEISVSLLRNENGKIIGFHGIAHDCTLKKTTEEALRQSEGSYRNILDISPDAYIISSIETERYIQVNHAFCEMTGYSAKEVLGRNALELNLYCTHHGHRRLSELISENGRLDGMEFTFRHKNGHKFECLVSARSILFKGEKCLLVVATDITQQKEMESKFLQAQKMEAMGTLAGGIAHDFNNILMGIQGHCSLIKMDTASKALCQQKLKGIEQLIQSGTALTHQLLSIAKEDKFEIQPADLNHILSTSAELFGRTQKEISIEKKLQQDLWTVEVDRNQIEQVLLNLFVNACHAMPDGGRLLLETRNVVLEEYVTRPYEVIPGKFVLISVTDNGIGMDAETVKKAFDPFFTTKEAGLGTGLGLASSYVIIRKHHGIIQVYSQKNVGSTFNIYLPTTEKEITSPSPSCNEMLLGDETILFVDDEETILQIGYQLLTRLGYKVITADSGSQAIDIYQLRQDEVDLVILDMIMPIMNGGKTFDELKKLNPDIRVLLASGYNINDQVKSILNRGCMGFIQKPFNLVALSQKVREVLSKAPVASNHPSSMEMF